MSVVEPGSAGANLIARVKAILLQPKPTWDVIEGEPATIEGLYKSYVIPLAAIPAVCGLIGSLVFGFGLFGVTFRPNPVYAVVQAIVQYALSLAFVFIMAVIIDELAPNFGGAKSRIQAFKVAAYSFTASWVAGVLLLIPNLGPLAALAGIYGLFILYLGLPRLMKVAEDKAVAYFALIIVVAVVAGLVISLVTSSIGGLGRHSLMSDAGTISGTVKTPTGSLDVGKLQAASERLAAAQADAKAGKVTLTDPEVLKGYLPGAVGGFARTGVNAESSAAGGMGASVAEGDYSKGEGSLKLKVTDMGATGALAGLAGAFNVQKSEESAGRYEKVGKINGRMTTETYDRTSKHGEYGVMVADRFMVSAEGDNVDMDDLKSAVGAIDLGRLEGLAKG